MMLCKNLSFVRASKETLASRLIIWPIALTRTHASLDSGKYS